MTYGMAILRAGGKSYKLIDFQPNSPITAALQKASAIVNELAKKITNLGSEMTNKYKIEWALHLKENVNKTITTLNGVNDIGTTFDRFEDINEDIELIIKMKVELFSKSIKESTDKFNTILADFNIQGVPLPDNLIALLRKDAIALFTEGETNYTQFYNEMNGYLDQIEAKLESASEINSDIFSETQESIRRVIAMYDNHVKGLSDSIIKGISDLIDQSEEEFNVLIGNMINTMILALTSNQFIQQLVDPNERNGLIVKVRDIQSIILSQTTTLFNLLRINKDNFDTHLITKDIEGQLSQLISVRQIEFKTKTDALMAKLKIKFSESAVFYLLQHMDTINTIENTIKDIKVNAFSAYFNNTELLSTLDQLIAKTTYDNINSEVVIKSNKLQSIVINIKLAFESSVKDLQNDIILELEPLMEDLNTLFTKEKYDPIFEDLHNTIDLNWQNALNDQKVNFDIANAYILNVLDDYYTVIDGKGDSLLYITDTFRDKHKKGKDLLNDYYINTPGKVETEMKNILASITSQTKEKINRIKDNETIKFIRGLKELSFLNEYFTVLDNVIKTFDDFYSTFDTETTAKIDSTKRTYYSESKEMSNEYNSNYDQYPGTTPSTAPCDLFSNSIPPLCHNVSLTDNMNKLNNQFTITKLSSKTNAYYTSLSLKQDSFIDAFLDSLMKIERVVKPKLDELVNSAEITTLFQSWKQMAIDFESKSLNQLFSQNVIKSINDIASKATLEFIEYSKTELNEMTQEYYDNFTTNIDNFEYKPREILYRLKQIYTFAYDNLLTIKDDVSASLTKSIQYTLKYSYQMIQTHYTSFLIDFPQFFLSDASVFIVDSIKPKVLALVNEIKDIYQSKLTELINQSNANVNIWDGSIGILRSELETVILPKFNTINANIENLINNMNKPENTNISQSKKLDFSVTNSIRGSSTILTNGEKALDDCLTEFDLDKLTKSFQTISSSALIILKTELMDYNKTMTSIENNIKKGFDSDVKGLLIKFYSTSKVNAFFATLVTDVFSSFTLNIDKSFNEAIEKFKSGVSNVINKEVARIKGLNLDSTLIDASFFRTLFTQFEDKVYNDIDVLLQTAIQNMSADLKLKLREQFNVKGTDITNLIDTIIDNNIGRFETLLVFSTRWDIDYAISNHQNQIKKIIQDHISNTDNLYLTNLIKDNYALIATHGKDLSLQVKSKVNATLVYVTDNLISKFNLTESPSSASIELSDDFKTEFNAQLDTLNSDITTKVRESNLKDIILNNAKVYSVSNCFNEDEYAETVLLFLSDTKNAITINTNQVRTEIKKYIDHHIHHQSNTLLGLIYNSDSFYTAIKDKCNNKNLKLIWASTNSKVNDMKDYSLSVLSTATTLKESVVNYLPTLVSDFSNEFKAIDATVLNKKIDERLSDYYRKTSSKVSQYFKSEFNKQIIQSTDIDKLNTIIKTAINVYDTESFKLSFDTTLNSEAAKANTAFTTPLKAEIEKDLKQVILNLSKQFNLVQEQFNGKTLQSANENLELIYTDTRAIIIDMKTLINQNISPYIFTPNAQVNTNINLLFDEFDRTLNPISAIFNEIQLEIKRQMETNVGKFSPIVYNTKEYYKRDILEKIIEAKENITDTMIAIKETITERLEMFSNDLYDMFFKKDEGKTRTSEDVKTGEAQNDEQQQRQLEQEPQIQNDEIEQNQSESLRQLQFTTMPTTFDIPEMNTAVYSLKFSLSNIESMILRVSYPTDIELAYFDYQNTMNAGLKNLRKPINNVLNILETILDSDYIQKVSTTMNTKVEEIRALARTNLEEVKNETNAINKQFLEQSSAIIAELNINVNKEVNNLLEMYMTLVTSEIKPYNNNSTDQRTFFKIDFILPVFGIPVWFTFGVKYGYSFGFDMKAMYPGIEVLAFIEDYVAIFAQANINLGVFQAGGLIELRFSKEKVSVGPYYNLFNFKVYLKTEVIYTMIEGYAAYYLKYPAIEFVKSCTKLFGYKICIPLPMLVMKTKKDNRILPLSMPKNTTSLIEY